MLDIFPYSGEVILVFGILVALIHLTFLSTKKDYLSLIQYSSQISIYVLVLVQAFNIYLYTAFPFHSVLPKSAFFNEALIVNNEILIFKIILVFFAIFIILFSIHFFIETQLGYFEYNILLLTSLLGCLITLSANDLLTLYISLEITALSFYILATIRKSAQSTEAGLKYFIIGSFSSAMLLFGISVIVVLTGHHNFDEIQYALYFNSSFENYNMGVVFGAFLIFSALLIKLAVAPFHEWVADIYEGILTPTALLFATIPKISLFFVIVRLVQNTFQNLFEYVQIFFAVSCFLSLILGSVSAMRQQNIKRFLAFSSVNHFGFILIGIVVGTQAGVQSSFVYLFFYMILTFGLWSILILLSYVKTINSKTSFYQLTRIVELGGLVHQKSGITFFIFVTLLSMGGIPPLAGFAAKTSIVFALIEKCQVFATSFSSLPGVGFNLILMAVFFSSVLSVFYYIRIIKILFFGKLKTNMLQFRLNSFVVVYILGFFCALNICSFVLFI